jgi:hypothetical protein
MSSLFITGVLVGSIICLDCGYLELNVNPEKVKLITKPSLKTGSPPVSCTQTSGHDFSSEQEQV